MQIAVNGTLMRGYPLNQNLVNLMATFVREDCTAPVYRLWSVDDVHPAMLRDDDHGAPIAIEIWELPAYNLPALLEKEPAGLCLGKLLLQDGMQVFGILGEPYLVSGQKEITTYRSWRVYMPPEAG